MDQPSWGSRDRLALSISEAAQVCGVRRRTIRRRHQAGEFERAYKDPDGTWRIPVSDLVAAGLRPSIVSDPDEPRIVFTAASQVDRLRTEVAVLRERVRALEIIAREREERVTDLRTILRMLPAPGGTEAEVVVTSEAETRQAAEAQEPPAEAQEQPSMEFVEEPPLEAEEEPPLEAVEEPLFEAEEEFLSDGVEEEPAEDGSSEPILILPDVAVLTDREPEKAEGGLDRSEELLEAARQRSSELLDDAMSLWWPSGASPTRSEASRSPASPWESPSTQRVDVAEAPAPAGGQVPARPDATATAGGHSSVEARDAAEEKTFGPSAVEEASFWLDSNVGRPPRHLRRRLGRFFRRHRRPR